jgi:cellulose biosynthesis protein BcsQ
MDNRFRHLTALEQGIVDKLMEQDFQGKKELLEQIKQCLVKIIDENGSLEFKVSDEMVANVDTRIPTEAEMEDEDGITIHVLLHVVDKKLDELEIYKDDLTPIIKTLNPSNFRLIQLG